MSLKDKVIIVTGAGSGIGLASSLILAKVGARVVMNGRDEEKLEQAKRQVIDAGGIVIAIVGNVAVEQDVAAMVDRAVSEFERLDGAFNNAGIGMHGKSTSDLEADEWDSVLDVNLRLTLMSAVRLIGRHYPA